MQIQDAVAQFLKTIIQEYGYSEQTVRAYRRELETLTEFLGGKTSVSSITLEKLREYLWHKNSAAPSSATQARTVAALKSFGKWLENSELVAANPASRLKTPKKQARLPRVIAQEQLETIFQEAATKAATGDPTAIRDYAILELLYASGIRVSELCNAKLADLNLSQQQLKVAGKGKKHRIVLFGAPATLALEKYLNRARAAQVNSETAHTDALDNLFLGARGGKLSSSTVYRLVAKYLPAGGSAPRGPHTLRHSAATHLLDGGAQMRVVQEVLGHESLASTQVYTQVSVERLASQYQQAHPRA